MAALTSDLNAAERSRWPVLRHYDAAHLRRISLPLGGIGTGTVGLGGRGDLRDWEVVNRPAKGFVPGPGASAPAPFVALRTGGAEPVTRCVEGPIDPADYEGQTGCPVANHGLPRFRHARFAAAYPLGQVYLDDPDVPLDVRLEAFNPLVPGDADASSLPVAILRYVLINPTDQPVDATLCATVPNFIGSDGTESRSAGNRNTYREGDGLRGVMMTTEGVPRDAATYGSLALVTLKNQGEGAGDDGDGLTWRQSWARLGWGDSLLDFWDDLSDDGRLELRDGGDDQAMPTASLAPAVTVPPRGLAAVTFLIGWHFPNRQTWTPVASTCDAGSDCCAPPNANTIGNHYTTRFRDAWDAVAHVAAHLPELERQTVRFVEAFVGSDLPEPVKEAALFNLSTLRSQTVFRTPDGHLYGWEGCHDKGGCCFGSCTHVWNYETALGLLFGDLSRSMREVEFLHATDGDGRMSFRVHLPLDHATEHRVAAADGQMGAIVRAYRDARLAGDEAWLARLWPRIKAALAFAWIAGGWDGDRDGVMEGCQHNTMDVEYFGPNPQMGAWYLAALRAAEQIARRLDDEPFADTCRDLFERGRAWIDAHLFNGEYYEHHVQPPTGPVPEALRAGMGTDAIDEPAFQLGAGCLVDQLVGQYMAHLSGLGHLLEPEHVRTTLAAIRRHNFRQDFHGHFNHLRSYVLGDESALLMATYPRGRRPAEPFPYFNEVMTGFEYTAAVGMIQEGLEEIGVECIAAIRRRYDGWRRNPFDEAECGHHYARALASWSAVPALTGFDYDGLEQVMRFAAADERVQWFWSTGHAWGTLTQRPEGRCIELTLHVLHGPLRLRRLEIAGAAPITWDDPCTLATDQRVSRTIDRRP